MMKEFKLTRRLLSSYYIAALFSFLFFQMLPAPIQGITTWLISALKVSVGVSVNNTSTWFALFFVCFAITWAIRVIIVEPLGFYINDEGAPFWELIILTLLVLGFYVYLLNQVFDYPMPETLPKFVLQAVDGYKNTYVVTSAGSIEERNTWAIVPWLWNFGPITFMYVRTKLMKDKDEK
jgi:hypothetical protein